jgi:GNAT superfamily N-acetyltransferase
MSIGISPDDTVIVHKHYAVTRASARDSMVIAGMTRGEWSERVAVSKRRNIEATSSIADDLKKGGALVLSRHQVPIGALIYVPVKGAAWEIRRLGVVGTYAGRGFTSLLMQAIEASARRHNIQALRVAVEASKDNVRRYFEDQGFRVVSAASFLTQFANASRPITLQKFLM